MEKRLFYLFMILLWSSSQALHLVRLTQMNNDFLKMIEKIPDYPEEDPLNLTNLVSRQQICDQIIAARQYISLNRCKRIPLRNISESSIVSEYTNFQRLRTSLENRPIDPDYLKYSERNVSLGMHYMSTSGKCRADRKHRPTRTMKLLECVRTAAGNWFIHFRAHRERMFLFENSSWNRGKIRVKGLLEPPAEYNINYPPDVEGLEKRNEYFFEQVKEDTVGDNPVWKVPEKMELCSVTFNEHVRLCSAAFESLSQPDVGLFSEDLEHVNYCQIGRTRCTEKFIEVSGGIIRANVLPCSINRTWSKPQFYVLADSHVSDAAFILMSVADDKQNTLKLIARLTKLVVLMDRHEDQNISEK